MNETLISFETAKLAKEKGFNLNSQAFYGCDHPSSGKANQLVLRTWEKWENFGNEDSSQEGTMIYSAPTQGILQKWLREVHNIDVISIPQSGVIANKYYYYLILINGKEVEEFDNQERFGNILEKSVQDVEGNFVNDELLNKYLFEDGFAFNTYEASLEAGLYNALQLIK